MNLLTFPFAGGSIYSYASCFNFTNPGVKVIPFEYPGRGARLRDKLQTNIHNIVDDLFARVAPHIHTPYCFYGHSMGTVIGYLLTKKIIRAQLPLPQHLFMTGRGGPSVIHADRAYHKLPRPKLIEKLRAMGGCPEEVLNDDSLMNFFEPIIRADFEALETYQYEKTDPFDIPITVMIGTEELVTTEDALCWQDETSRPIRLVRLPGSHFFIFNRNRDLLRIIASEMQLAECE